jgi:hypothetical protein
MIEYYFVHLSPYIGLDPVVNDPKINSDKETPTPVGIRPQPPAFLSTRAAGPRPHDGDSPPDQGTAAGAPAEAPLEHPDNRRRPSPAQPPTCAALGRTSRLHRASPGRSSDDRRRPGHELWHLPWKDAGQATSCAKSLPSPARPRASTAPRRRRPGRALRHAPPSPAGRACCDVDAADRRSPQMERGQDVRACFT